MSYFCKPSRVQINCTQCYRPNIVVNTYSDSESDSDSEYDPRDSESDSDGSFVSENESDTETEASVSEEEDSESEADSDSDVDLREVKPYHGQGFRVYFDSVKDRRHFMRAFGFN